MNRIAITGIGVVSPLGSDIATLWDNLIQAKSGVVPVEDFAGLPVTFGGPARDFDPSRYMGSKEQRHLDRYSQMAVTAGLDAYYQSFLKTDTYSSYRTGVLIGTGSGGISTLEKQIPAFIDRGPKRVSPLTAPMFIGNTASAELAMRIHAKGPGMGISSACATGGHALAVSMRFIQSGDADCMIAGGVE
ncbi:MAG TPA: beta-ketoacyl-[acyl-carrier-protein] synthase II, partial [Deltaproteobacteria bacterium]|nr:beta-ketoacyl-[acyl-carrier-protein] synthase II [Deltaproteobacteria bacterium]